MAFDPHSRVETWVFQQVNTVGNRPVYRRMGFNYVAYDNDPERYLEPRNGSETVDSIGGTHRVLDPVEYCGQVGGFEFLNRHLPVHSFGDFDVKAALAFSGL